jgi:3-hydroxyisobutyrate dehydrogenase/2-hydroxy-3-oxopropionate reductase
MGSSIARALARNGHRLTLYNRSEDVARGLADELGATAASTPAAAVAEVEVAITMLADGAAVESVYRGPDGILEGLREGTVLLDMSTVEPQVSQSLESDVRARGAFLLDAPVSGSTSTAESGQLTIMVGGDADALARVKPVLDALASRVFHLGPAGTGAAMKLAVNAVVFGLDIALSEGLVLAERAGVEPERAYDVFQASAIGAPLVTYKRANFLAPESTPTAFSLDLAAKDLGLITSLGDAVAVRLAQAEVNLELIRRAASTLGGGRDFAEVATHLRESSG